MIAIGWVTNIFQRGAASMGRLKYILTAEPGINDAACADRPVPHQSAFVPAADGNGHGPAARDLPGWRMPQ